MILLGEFALWVALPVSIWGIVLAFVGGQRKRGDLVLSAERSVYAVFFLLCLTSLGIILAFVGEHYEYRYVWGYSSRELETYFKVTGLWAGQRGSLVFWVLLLALFSSIAVFQNRRKNREFMPSVVGVLLTITAFFLGVLLFADVNPFERLPFTPANGQGLNPQLQNYWMTIHPPTLYLGFTSFSVPFAFGIAALITGKTDSRWLVVTRRWTLLSWFFLTNGIIFGMRWAYEELGWGGYWFWDPVENASLLPWLTATAFLHSVMIQEHRGMLKMWNLSLVSLTFLLTIFATFLTRSGLIESVHSFAQNTRIAYIFLAFLGAATMASVLLILWRKDDLRAERTIESFLSRESAFLMNNLILLGSAFAVLWGTLFPLISEGVAGTKVAVGPAFFNRVNIPIGLVLLALTGIGPVIAWRKATRRNLERNFLSPLLMAAAVTAGLMIAGMRGFYALATFAICGFVLTILATEFWKGTRARARIEGEGPGRAFLHLIARNRRRWGGYIVHVGIVLMFAGFAGASFHTEIDQSVEPGDQIRAASPYGHEYVLTYQGLSSSRTPNMWQWVALMDVSRDGRRLGTITAEQRIYSTADQPIREVGIRSTPLEDVYVILAGVEDFEGAVLNESSAQGAVFQVLVRPLVGWLWYGGLVITLGSLIALWPGAGGPARRKVEAAPASARLAKV